MIFGPTLIVLSGVFATISLLLYAVGGARPGIVRPARVFYAGVTVLVTAASAFLMYLFIAHRFEFQYVFAYSSLDLPLKYTISSFWGGQEGTFLLWLWLGTVLGWAIIARARQYERWAMVFYLLVQIFLIVVLAVRSPFAPTGFEAADGRGLNPLLQNPWMVIHPPIVFLGFAALAIPFAYGMASLVRKDYASFPRMVLPWVGLGVISLGVGIFLGGYWAYKTLGWGGYWGWDPVENSSLIPWIVSLALLHGLLIQRRKNKLIRTNLMLSIVALLLVIYGTFLTRSGVLADFSVHSFTDLGINAYLVGFMILLAVACPGFLLFRVRSIKTERLDSKLTSREFGLAVGLLLLLVIAFLVFLGTSAPLLTRIFGDPANVAMSYYHSVSVPSGIFLLLVLIVVPFTLRGGIAAGDLLKKITWPGVGAAIITIITILSVDLKFSDLVLVFFGLWALGANVYAMFLPPGFRFSRIGGRAAHIGFALMVLGIVASSDYDTAERVSLITGVPETVLGHQVTFLKMVDAPRVEDSYLKLELDSGNKKKEARPKLFYSDYTRSTMRSPHVLEGLTGDYYLSPLDLQVIEEPGGRTQMHLIKDQPQTYGDYTITFTKFETGEHMTGDMKVGAAIVVAGPDDTVTVTPEYILQPGKEPLTSEIAVPGTDLSLSLNRILVDSKSVLVTVTDAARAASAPGVEMLTLEISRKPLISLVWLGITIITLGTTISFFRRWPQSFADANDAA